MKVEIPYNYVLVKIDPDYNEYVLGELKLTIASDEKSASRKLAVTGTVEDVCQNLYFSLKDEREMGDYYTPEFSTSHRYSSVTRDVEIELKVGDKIYFDYTQQYEVGRFNRIIFNEQGEQLCFVRYDFITGVSENGFIRPINGNVIIDPIEYDVEIVNNKIQKIDYGLEVNVKLRNRPLQGKKKGVGVVRAKCDKVKGYTDFPQYIDHDENDVEIGDLILFNNAYSLVLEYDLHQTLQGKYSRLRKITRKDIFGKIGIESDLV